MNASSNFDLAGRGTGGDAAVQGLHRWEVDTVFGVPGVQLDQFFDALHRKGGDIRLIHTRHEQGAAYMALGYAMVTGRPGVCTVVPGPGLLNAGAALATAYACNARVLCLTSTINSALIDRRHGALHEINDQAGLLRNLTKWTARASHPSEIPDLIDEAFRQLMTGRPRPVALELPPDVLAQAAPFRYARSRPEAARPPVDSILVEAAAAACAEAKSPLIVVGGGALGARDEVRRLAALLQAPVVSRNMGRGVLRDQEDFALPAAAAIDLWKEADLVIGIGTRLQQLREWGYDGKLRVVRIDLDPTEMTRVAPPTVALYADATDGTRALVDAVQKRGLEPAARVDAIHETREAFSRDVSREMQPQVAYLDAIRSEMADDDIFVDEMTQVGYAAKFALPIFEPRTFVNSSYQGTLGYGFATALGAQVGAGGRRVISVNGDGGFMYTMPELASAVLHKIPLTAIVFSDGNFGNVRRIQQTAYGGRLIASHLHNPDFAALANLFGAVGLRAESPEELKSALQQARLHEGPVVIEAPMRTDDLPSPWKHIHGRKVR